MPIRKKHKKNEDISQQTKMTLSESSSFAVQEAYKTLRTNLIFSLPDSNCKCIGITSSQQGEGKSQNILNLAISFAQIGKKVLLMDCDLRLPTIAAKLGIPGRPGLSEFLVGQNTWNEVVKTGLKQNIDVLPAGTTPPDATRLLQSEMMKKLLDAAKKVYDYIFLDLPPVTVVSDAVILAPVLDGYILVVKERQSTYRTFSSMCNQLQLADAKVLGIVCTNVNVNEKRYYSGYYGYGK